MKKLNLFDSFRALVIVSGLLILPTKANIIESKNLSETVNIASIDNNRDRNNSAEEFKKIIGIVGLTCGSSIVAYQLFKNNKSSTGKLWHNRSSNALLLNRVSPKLRQKLISLVHDRQTANRLLMGTMSNHSNRSPNWLAEKVIYDLERDR
ncbi:MAG: hypothetical protein Tsb0014_27420 [Pleurocapsa sp.]